MSNPCADPDDPKAQMRAQQQAPIQGAALRSSPVQVQPTATMNIVVPQGLQPGDQWNITTPDGQQLTIRCPEGASGGQTVSINYQPRNLGPGPTVIGAPVGIPVGNPMYGGAWDPDGQRTAVVQMDQSAANNAWVAYCIGWALCCCCGPVGPIFWFAIACMHFVKPKEQRDLMQAEKQVATVSLTTGLMCTIVPLIFILIIVSQPRLENQVTWRLIAVNQTCPMSEGMVLDTVEGDVQGSVSDESFKSECQSQCAAHEQCRFFEWSKAWDDYAAFPQYFMTWCNLRDACGEEGRSNVTVPNSDSHVADPAKMSEIWQRFDPETVQ